jgi:hypothetical protein
MRRLFGVFLALLLGACSSGPDLQLPEGLVELELYEMVTSMNPLWDPVERAVTDVRLLAGRRVSEDRYEFDAEYEVLSITTREPMSVDELQRTADSMRSQGREAEWKRMEARRIAAEKYLAGRVGDMKPGDKRWFRDTFVLVRQGDHWIPAPLGDPGSGRAAETLD